MLMVRTESGFEPVNGNTDVASGTTAMPDWRTGAQFYAGVYSTLSQATLSATGDYAVNWGDGSVTNHPSGTTATHDWSNVATDLMTNALVVVTPQAGHNLLSLDLKIASNTIREVFLSANQLTSILAGYTGLSDTNIKNLTVHPTSLSASQRSAFRGLGGLESVKHFDASGITSLYTAFSNASMASINIVNTSSVTDFTAAFQLCGNLLEAPMMDTSNTTVFTNIFAWCSKLTSIPALDMRKATNASSAFAEMSNLTNIDAFGCKVSVSLANAVSLPDTAINKFFTNLGIANSGAVVNITNTLGVATCDRSIATAKGWTVTG